ncbi:MAG: nicotinate-nucleotide pyrophosphorylase (carboxylating) [Porticoccus sp.]|jgi:nicotinate-nucleotide pyrophosphorylase (carboxylating)
MLNDPLLVTDIQTVVKHALEEDIRDGDITAMLIPENNQAEATVITREHAIVCGQPWVDEVFRQLDPNVEIEWLVSDGDEIQPGQTLFKLKGLARSLLTGERTALNFLQTLSGTATTANQYSKLVEGTDIKVLDTRKTIPGLRLAQKYAVKVGGCHNHRIGLYDAFLIKENHIAACGGISAAVGQAREIEPRKLVEVEVESLEELQQALDAGADIVMLDNFDTKDLEAAVTNNQRRVKLEVSGNLETGNLTQKAIMGINYLSSGSLTKNCHAIDFSMRLNLLPFHT